MNRHLASAVTGVEDACELLQGALLDLEGIEARLETHIDPREARARRGVFAGAALGLVLLPTYHIAAWFTDIVGADTLSSVIRLAT